MPITKLDVVRSQLQNKARMMRDSPRFIMFSSLQAFIYVAKLKQFNYAFTSRSPFTLEETTSLKKSFKATYERKVL